MKNNQLLTLAFESCEITLEHLTLYGSLTRLLHAANVYRIADNHGQAVQLASLLSSVGFSQQVALLEKDDTFKADSRGAWFKSGKGRSTDTRAHIMLLLYTAQVVSPRFHYEFNKRVVLDRLCAARDESGDGFKDMNAMLAMVAENVLGKPSHTGHYVNLAKAIKSRISPDGDNWNTATAAQLHERTRIEEGVAGLLRLGLVRDWEHLKELVERV